MGLFDIPFYIKNTIKSGLFKLYCKKNVIKKKMFKKIAFFCTVKVFYYLCKLNTTTKTTKHK